MQMTPSTKTMEWLLLLSLISRFISAVAEGDPVEQRQVQAVTAAAAAPNIQPMSENSQPQPQQQQQQQQQSVGPLFEQPNIDQQQPQQNEGGNTTTATGGGVGGGRALAAPLLRGAENAVELNGEHKPFFKIHYRDGVQKAIFDETPRLVPPAADFEDTNSVGGAGADFDAYDDSRLVAPQLEQPLFIPEIYRNDTREGSTKAPKGGGPLTTKVGTMRPLVSPELQSRQPITVRTTTTTRPTVRPAHPFVGRPPPPAPAQQPRLPPQTQSFRPPPPLPSNLSPPFRPNSLPPPVPHPPNVVPPRPTSNQQQPQRPVTPNIGIGQIRTGVCHQAIFYTPQAVAEADIQRIYTHFAMVVSVDQCARTCHEFNCDVAILDPISRHCQFNPSTAFRPHPACPQWPNPLFRNNVRLGQEPVRIACVTCQQRRRVPKPTGQNSPMPFNGQGKQQQQITSVAARRPAPGVAPPPQNVIRTTVRDRLNAGPSLQNGENGPLRIANAAAVLKATAQKGGEERDLSAEFHKLERLLKSAEDYLDEMEPQKAAAKQQTAKEEEGGRGTVAVGREVPSWAEGHPQGEGFSPLRINPLRRPYMDDPSRPHAIFYSTDKVPRPKMGDNDSQRDENGRAEEFFRRRRIR